VKAVLVTGASSGIGAAAAHLLATRGFRVFGASRSPAEGEHVLWIPMDVRDEASVAAGVAHAAGAAGGLDALVCAAGYGVFGSVEETTAERARGSGRIVVVGSLAGRAPIPFQAHYSASKAALDALVLALRNELAGTGVEASLVEPGDIRTAFNDRMDWGDGVAASAYGDRLRRCEKVVRDSLPKAPGPEIVAETIVRALTDPRPRVRYTVGPDSLAVPLGRRLLPDALALALIRRHFQV
jgi:NAD(P)-dependent dehydrogenase (short-subunit alcohol dehydrogenase family)